MKTYYSHLDKLEYSFQLKSMRTIYIPNFSFKYSTNVNDFFKSTYRSHHTISYESTPGNFQEIGYINSDKITLEGYSYISFANWILNHQSFQDILNQLIESKQFPEIKIKKMEVAIDTTEPILFRYNKKFYFTNDLIFDKGYAHDYYGKGDEKKKLLNNRKSFLGLMGNETIYIKCSTDQLTSPRIIKNKYKFVRLENKTKEIENHSHKNYIIKYLNDHIDTTKTIYRMEISIDANTLSNTRNKTYTYIDYTRLTDSNYLTSIFNYYSPFNHEMI
jgi:hypothetical protein